MHRVDLDAASGLALALEQRAQRWRGPALGAVDADDVAYGKLRGHRPDKLGALIELAQAGFP